MFHIFKTSKYIKVYNKFVHNNSYYYDVFTHSFIKPSTKTFYKMHLTGILRWSNSILTLNRFQPLYYVCRTVYTCTSYILTSTAYTYVFHSTTHIGWCWCLRYILVLPLWGSLLLKYCCWFRCVAVAVHHTLGIFMSCLKSSFLYSKKKIEKRKLLCPCVWRYDEMENVI